MKRYGKAKTAERKTEAMLSEHDRAELEKFRSFLQDHKMPLPELIVKYGAPYLGFSEAELVQVASKDV